MTDSFSLRNKKIWVAGHNGLVGSALVRRLCAENCAILTVDKSTLDLRRQEAVEKWMGSNRPDAIILAAAKVGGIQANKDFPADFLHDNLTIQSNVIQAAHRCSVEKLLFLGSSCIYPREAAQPITEDALLTAPLEPTNEAYAVAKIAGIKMCQSYRAQYGSRFIAAMPCNLYGPGDRYDALQSHVIPALIMKIDAAKARGENVITLWGTGTPRREFLHVDDAADGLVFLLRHYEGAAPVNMGAGDDITIAELAAEIAAVVGYQGSFAFDATRPDGVMRKLMDSTKIYGMGWRPGIELRAGLRDTYEDYKKRRTAPRAA